MAKEAKRPERSGRQKNRHGHWLPRLPAIERPIILLRWLALLLVLILHWFDRSTAGVFFPVPQMALVLVGCNGLLLLLMRYVRWLQRPLNYLAVDTFLATLAVYLTGGYHSSFFVLYVFIIIGAAVHLELARTIIVALAIGLIYVGACYVNPAGLEFPYAQYILSAKLLLLLVVAVLCGLLLEQLRREHQETERERALAQRLKALNDLFQHLNTTLDLSHTLQTVAEAPKALLGADLTIITLLDEDGRHLSVAAAAGVDVALLAEQRWPVDDALVSAILSGRQPYVIEEPPQHLEALWGIAGEQQAALAVASLVSVPLLLGDQPLGDLDVAYFEPRTFSGEDLAFLQALGQEAALAIRNARLYERERTQVARLRALEKLQESFVSSVSHELRTPLTCIKTSMDLLQATSGNFSQEQGDLVSTIGHHVGRLEGLVSDLLEITKLEAGQITLSRQPTDLRQIASRVVQALYPLTERKGQTVDLHCPASLSQVQVDRRRIEQVLTNVLSNAIKFTPKQGQIDVYVTETPDSLRVCVADSGPGISAEEQGRVFDRFYVVTDGRGLSGVGLGLYIARQMIELHGGSIWVESEVGAGSTFCFTVPKTIEERQG
jgi:signal transduction histidine kinase